MAVRLYAQILGVVLILIGVVGLLLGDGLLLGILNIDVIEDIVHILTGGILAYVGFGRLDAGAARSVVGVWSVRSAWSTCWSASSASSCLLCWG